MTGSGTFYCPVCQDNIPNALLQEHDASHDLIGDRVVDNDGPDGWAVSLAGLIVALGIIAGLWFAN